MKFFETSEQTETTNAFVVGFLMIVGIMLLIGVVSKEVSASYEVSGIDLTEKISLKE